MVANIDVQLFKDKACKLPYSKLYTLKVYRTKTALKKGVVVNPFGGVFGMPKQSSKNILHKILSRSCGGVTTNTYCIVVTGEKTYFQTDINFESL
jgi:hypothetical protein